ncbi:MAG: 2-dehydropantoate 2-reductase, partial [Actinomycetota bacterium]
MSTSESKRIAVVGAGGVGGVFAAHLSAAHEVLACVRRPFERYRIESPKIPFDGPADVCTSADDVPWDRPADAVFVGLKAQHTAGASPWFDRLCGPETLVVAMQNGIEAEQRLTPLVNGATVVPSVVYCGAELLAPGHVRHSSSSLLIVADDEAGHRAAELVGDTPLTIKPSADVITAAWTKLGVNSAANGLTGLLQEPMGVLAEPGVASIANKLLTECWTIGNRFGADLDLDGIPTVIAQMADNNGRTSMQQDVEAGKPTEHDAIHG